MALGSNKFNCLTDPPLRVDYWVVDGGDTKVGVYNVAGQVIRGLVSANLQVGAYTTYWDGKDDTGSSAYSGLYLVAVKEPKRLEIKKVLVFHR